MFYQLCILSSALLLSKRLGFNYLTAGMCFGLIYSQHSLKHSINNSLRTFSCKTSTLFFFSTSSFFLLNVRCEDTNCKSDISFKRPRSLFSLKGKRNKQHCHTDLQSISLIHFSLFSFCIFVLSHQAFLLSSLSTLAGSLQLIMIDRSL